MVYRHIQAPSEGEKITVNEDLSLSVPDNPIIPYIEGAFNMVIFRENSEDIYAGIEYQAGTPDAQPER